MPEGVEPFRLRPFLMKHLAAAYDLDQLCFPPNVAYSLEELRHYVARPSAYAIVAEAEGALAGFVVGSHTRRRMAHIITLDVAPEFRRQGIASALMDASDAYYRALGKDGIALEVALENEAAQRFYLGRGFMPSAFLRNYYAAGLHAIAMRKEF